MADKVKSALEKIKEKKKEVKKEEPKEETPTETPQDEETLNVIDVLQNAGVYRREVLLKLNQMTKLQEEGNDYLKQIVELLKS